MINLSLLRQDTDPSQSAWIEELFVECFYQYTDLLIEYYTTNEYYPEYPTWERNLSFRDGFKSLTDVIKEVRDDLRDILKVAYSHGITFADSLLGVSRPVTITPEDERNFMRLDDTITSIFSRIDTRFYEKAHGIVKNGYENKKPWSLIEAELIDALERETEIASDLYSRTIVMEFVNEAMDERYHQYLVKEVDWFTADDEKVCGECVANADGSPYPIDKAPDCPAHDRCRCILIPHDRGLLDTSTLYSSP